MSLFAVTPNVGRDYVFGLCFDIGPRVISSLAIISAGCFNLINVVSLRSRSRMYVHVCLCLCSKCSSLWYHWLLCELRCVAFSGHSQEFYYKYNRALEVSRV